MISVRRSLVLAAMATATQASSILSFSTMADAHPSKAAIEAVANGDMPTHRVSRLNRLRPHR